MKHHQYLQKGKPPIVAGCLKLTISMLFGLMSAITAAQENVDIHALRIAVGSELRQPENAARDTYRHPLETLAFFNIGPSSSVVEIWPGRGWYSEILAPYLAAKGTFYAAHLPQQSDVVFFQRSLESYAHRLSTEPELFAGTELTEFYPPYSVVAGPEGEVDFVLTFRNVHNWMKAGFEQQAFVEFYNLLKPGGILGVVEHRAKPLTTEEEMITSGYVTEERVIKLAANAGFVFESASEINANLRDTKDHPKGVWTLPPTLRLGEEERQYYLAIGESDRMTLKFRKPAK